MVLCCNTIHCSNNNNHNTTINNHSDKSNVNNAISTHYKYNNITYKLNKSNVTQHNVSNNTNYKYQNNINSNIFSNILNKYKQYDHEFNVKLNNYVKLAKKIFLKRKIQEYDIRKLFNSAMQVLDHIKFNNLYKKFNNVEEVIFNSISKLNYNNKFEERIIKFTMSFFYVFTTLNEKYIIQIIEKNPLELIPLLNEMNVFAKFITADAPDYGHSNFSVKHGNVCKITANKQAIMKIMGNLIKMYLINSRKNKIYKLSNTASEFYYCESLYNHKINYNNQKSITVLYQNILYKLGKQINNNRVTISESYKNKY
ncbi:MAG: hypothetical protein IJ848_02875 [Alphaproteobacteria bacterium]|nr:hypothetical protein [Alphaproteobacteria bacterium]